MKLTHANAVLLMVILSLVVILLGACGSSQPVAGTTVQADTPVPAEPQIIVVTATPTSAPRLATPAPSAGPTATPARPVEPAAPPLPAYRAGSLLKGSGDAVYYLGEDGLRRIADEATFTAFGFVRGDVVAVTDDVLAGLPPAGYLTRLVVDDRHNFYWVAAGRRWQVNEWQTVVGQAGYTGPAPSSLDGLLAAALPARRNFEAGMLLQAGETLYFVAYNAIIPLPDGVGAGAAAIDVPVDIVAVYPVRTQLDEGVAIQLKAGTPGANVRQGPGVDYEVIGAVNSTDSLGARGRTAAGDWLQILYQGQPGWLAANLVEASPALTLLPVVNSQVRASEVPAAEPAALVETAAPAQPRLCDSVPIRGFGQVWGAHLEVQAELGCPYSWNGGEQGTRAAVQSFENGLMVWLEADSSYTGDPVYVFFADGTFQRFGDLGPADPAKVEEVPAGFFAVGDKFGKVYWEGTGAQVKERLGYATGPAGDSAGAYQQFDNGRMFWLEATDQIFVIYDYYNYKGDEPPVHIRTWTSFDDIF